MQKVLQVFFHHPLPAERPQQPRHQPGPGGRGRDHGYLTRTQSRQKGKKDEGLQEKEGQKGEEKGEEGEKEAQGEGEEGEKEA